MDLHDEISHRACILAEDNLPSFQARIRAGDAQMFIDDHFVQIIKAAMHIGASIMLEKGLPPIAGEVPEAVFVELSSEKELREEDEHFAAERAAGRVGYPPRIVI